MDADPESGRPAVEKDAGPHRRKTEEGCLRCRGRSGIGNRLRSYTLRQGPETAGLPLPTCPPEQTRCAPRQQPTVNRSRVRRVLRVVAVRLCEIARVLWVVRLPCIAEREKGFGVPDRIEINLAGDAAITGRAKGAGARFKEFKDPVQAPRLVEPRYEMIVALGSRAPPDELVRELMRLIPRNLEQLHRADKLAVEMHEPIVVPGAWRRVVRQAECVPRQTRADLVGHGAIAGRGVEVASSGCFEEGGIGLSLAA